MRGVTNAFERDKVVSDFIKKNERNIYSGGFMKPFDVRGYARFIKEHQFVRRHIVGGANRTLFSVDLPPRLCRTGT